MFDRMGYMSNHHTHESHSHNFINKHTAPAILLLVLGCFTAGYFLGQYQVFGKTKSFRSEKSYMHSDYMMSEYPYRPY